MALITRCPHCATAFRVTPLHLQAHGGDVRCGHCAQVFNAFSTLSTIQEPESGDLFKEKAEEAPEDTATGRLADESPALAVSDQTEPPPAPRHEITQTEALADTATPEAVIRETAVPEAVTQETVIPEALISEARTPEARTPEAGGAGTAIADALPQGQPASEPAPAERLTDGPDTASERFSTGSATGTASASEKIRTPGASELEAGELKAREPKTRANNTRAQKARAQQVHAKEPTQDTGQRETQEAHKQETRETHGQDSRENQEQDSRENQEQDSRENQEQDSRENQEQQAQEEDYAFDAGQPRQASAAWTFFSLLLLILFTGQTIYFYRAELATLVPAAKPYLEQYCELLQCTISLPRHPQLLNIESSDMHTDPQRPGVITLSATVRNHGSYPQAFPLFELTFIDNQNRPLASRIFKPDAYLGEDANQMGTVSPDSEFNARLHLDTGDLNAAGYRLSLLYPSS